MKRFSLLAMCGLALVAAGTLAATVPAPLAAQSRSAQAAALETRTYVVDNMTCALCPLTVKTAMEQVAGVRSVTVDFAARTATVTFDPAVATAEAIATASQNAGYPARPAGRS